MKTDSKRYYNCWLADGTTKSPTKKKKKYKIQKKLKNAKASEMMIQHDIQRGIVRRCFQCRTPLADSTRL